jgi:STE24 endopeptidase
MAAASILQAFICLSLVDLGWTLFLLVLNYREAGRRRGELPEWLPGGMNAEEARKATDYSRERMRLQAAETLVSVFAVLVLAASGFFGFLDSVLAPIASAYWRGAVFLGSLMLAEALLSAPFGLYGTFVIEKRFGFNTTTVGVWVLDRLKGAAIGAALGLPLLFLLYSFIDLAGDAWWLWAAVIFSAVDIVISLLFPLVVAPLFNKFSPLAEGGLKEKIGELSARLSFRFGGIFVMDGSKRSRHSNAYFTGMGRLKRIVLFDTLISQMTEGEVLAVLAHEIGHEKKRHMLKMTAIAVVGSFAAFWVLDLCMGWIAPSKHALLLIVGLVAGPATFFLTPCFSALSRKHEYEADAYASAATDPDSLASALKKLNVENAANLWPHPLYAFWYYSHPTLRDRLAAIERGAASPAPPPG